MCGGAIIADLLPELELYDLINTECSCILQNDHTLLRSAKRSRIASQSPCFSCTQVIHTKGYKLFLTRSRRTPAQGAGKPRRDSGRTREKTHREKESKTRWSLNTEISNKRRENDCNNSGKRKLCDRNVNLADNIEYCWPTMTKSSNEEDSDETSDSGLDSSSDSETYSGPSDLSF
ncbi:hypothetical protein VNO80_10425 [Phaseolus coccineus]|uniref:Uncharacterized protein n=1 Tax=Phaseolus coccineus TaxID=3886 RepID=A0AAN9N837_PHACN